MKKKYIKMNNSQKDLSLGNICRIIKELSLNKIFAGQTDVFCAIFNEEDVSDSTINNYCIGNRTIGKKYKDTYLKMSNEKDKTFKVILKNIKGILEGKIEGSEKNDILKELCLKLYNLAKNDTTVKNDFTKEIYTLIENEELEKVTFLLIRYAVLEKKQPIYEEENKKETIEKILENTNISMFELENFLKIQLQDGINYTYSLKKLAEKENPYACAELGEMEYKGIMAGKPRYIKSYEYLKIAAEKNHPRASWLIAKMFYDKKIGSRTKEDLKTAWKYLSNAYKLGSVAAINTIGTCYLYGYVPNEKKDEKKAIEYLEKAASHNYVYANNNLGKIYEKKKEYEKAYEYYQKSADLEESWACNKMGEYYRMKEDMKTAYKYYTTALKVPTELLDPWALYNLAKYYYIEGSYEVNIEKDEKKATEYLERAYNLGVNPALEELIYIYINEYLKEDKNELIEKINHSIKLLSKTDYYNECQEKINQKLNKIKEKYPVIIKLD